MKAPFVILLFALFVAVSAVPPSNPSVKTSGGSMTTLPPETSPPSTGSDDIPSQDGGSYVETPSEICINAHCVCDLIRNQANELLDVPTDEYNMIDESFLEELNDDEECHEPGGSGGYGAYCFSPGEIDNIHSQLLEDATGNQVVYDMICST